MTEEAKPKRNYNRRIFGRQERVVHNTKYVFEFTIFGLEIRRKRSQSPRRILTFEKAVETVDPQLKML